MAHRNDLREGTQVCVYDSAGVLHGEVLGVGMEIAKVRWVTGLIGYPPIDELIVGEPTGEKRFCPSCHAQTRMRVTGIECTNNSCEWWHQV